MLCTLAIVLAWRSARAEARAVIPVAPGDRLMKDAGTRARATLDALRPHIGSPRQVGVKFPLRRDDGGATFVWGTPEAMDAGTVTVRLVAPPVDAAVPDGPMVVPLADVEDWQVFLDDGRILGGYGTRAQMAIARRYGHAIPRAMRAQEPRFVDA